MKTNKRESGEGNHKNIKIGLAWRSMIRSSARSKHYLSVEDLSAFRGKENIEIWVLQPDWDAGEINQLREIFGESNVHLAEDVDLIDDFERQAALIVGLDAVISPCSTTAELASALGIKTYILSNSYMTSWRKNEDGSDIWYANSRLITGENVGNKRTLVLNLIKEIDYLSGKHSG